MFDHPAIVSRSEGSQGYMLLETVVALAISSSLVLLLVATLNGLSRSQERINAAVETMSQDMFDDAFIRSLFAGVKPDYADTDAPFTGERYKISARTYAEGWSPPGGERFTLEIEPGTTGVAKLTVRESTAAVEGLGQGDLQLEYVDHFGRVSETWQAGTDVSVDRQLQRLAPFTNPIPRQVRIVRRVGESSEILIALDLAPFDWPAARPQDDVFLIDSL